MKPCVLQTCVWLWGEYANILIGCGTGNCSIALSPLVGHVHGLEHSKGMLAKAQEKTQHLTNVELQEGDITCMPYLDEYLDGIIINQVHSV